MSTPSHSATNIHPPLSSQLQPTMIDDTLPLRDDDVAAASCGDSSPSLDLLLSSAATPCSSEGALYSGSIPGGSTTSLNDSDLLAVEAFRSPVWKAPCPGPATCGEVGGDVAGDRATLGLEGAAVGEDGAEMLAAPEPTDAKDSSDARGSSICGSTQLVARAFQHLLVCYLWWKFVQTFGWRTKNVQMQWHGYATAIHLDPFPGSTDAKQESST